MRGGKFQQKNAGEDGGTMRNAEMLFQTRSIVEIREVERKTRKDIEEKKEELRQLVGASYRDLIESADSILGMRRSCESVLGNLRAMEDGFRALKASISAARVTPKADRARRRKAALYSVSCRIKYLVDTPEKIWGCLDEHLFLEASERYVRAREVHQLLLASQQQAQTLRQQSRGQDQGGGGKADGEKQHPGELLSYFPLLRHQWPLVETFRSQISQRSRERLEQQGPIAAKECAVALAAIAVIDGLSSAQILTLFLDSRRNWIQQLAAAASAAPALGSSQSLVPKALSRVVSIIQESLCQAGQLFLDVASASQQRPLFFETLLETPPESQLFGGLPDPEAEIQAWKAHREQLEVDAGAGLTWQCVSNAVRQWLSACAQDLASESKALLASASCVSSLAIAEEAIREAIANKGAFEGSQDWLASAFGKPPDHPWDAACELLLREPVDLWGTLFEGLFTQRAREIIAAAFSDLRILEELDAALADSALAGAAMPSGGPDSSFLGQRTSSNSNGRADGMDEPDAQQLLLEELGAMDAAGIVQGAFGQSNSHSEGREGRWTWAALGPTSPGNGVHGAALQHKDSATLHQEVVARLCARVDAGLHSALQDVLTFLIASPEASFASARVKGLAPCLQSAAFASFSALITALDQRLASTTAAPGPPSPQAIEQALLVGRLCGALSKDSLWLPVVLGPPDDWASAGLPLAQAALPRAPSGSHAQLRASQSERLRLANTRSSLGPGGVVYSCDGAALLEAIASRRKQRSSSSAVSATAMARHGGARTSAPSTLTDGQKEQPKLAKEQQCLREIQRGLRRLNVSAHAPWINQTAQNLCGAFLRSLKQDEALSTSSSLKGWEETVVKQASLDGKGSDVEMKMLLPAMPSSYALALLYCACACVQRTASGASGTDALDPAVLQMLAWRLSYGVLDAYDALLKTFPAMVFASAPAASGAGQERPFPAVSEKGILQLLFDLRFVTDVLAGGQDLDPAALPDLPSLSALDTANAGSASSVLLTRMRPSGLPGGAGAGAAQQRSPSAVAQKKRVAGTIEALHSRLDPIDWAAYEHYLWQNEQRYYLRTAVLLGNLVQLQRLYSDASARKQRYSRQTDASVLNMAATVPRFVFLPISSPTTATGPGAKRRPSFGEKQTASAAAAAAAAAASAYGALPKDGMGPSPRASAAQAQGATSGLDPLAAFSFAADPSGLTSAFAGGANPLFKSIMGQVKLGSSLGEMLPSQAAGLFSSLTHQHQGGFN